MMDTELIFACYRCDFPSLDGYTDDCGWGCTIRSGQMMVANALRRAGSAVPYIEAKIMDEPDRQYSIHSIVREATEFSCKAGEWFSPSVTLKSIQKCSRDEDLQVRVFNGAVPEFIEEKPLLLILSTRLGLDSIPDTISKELKKILKDTRCVGIVGGKRTSSYYFVDVEDGMLVYLDPHELRNHLVDGYKVSRKKTLKISDLDPSVAVGFLVLKGKQEVTDIMKSYSLLFESIVPEKSMDDYEVEEEDGFCVITGTD